MALGELGGCLFATAFWFGGALARCGPMAGCEFFFPKPHSYGRDLQQSDWLKKPLRHAHNLYVNARASAVCILHKLCNKHARV